MSITDELRLFAADPYTGWVPTDKQQADLRAIADRIDAEHERVRAESIIDMTDESMAEHGFVRLPKDADGEYIHVGDVMEWVRYKDDDPTIVRTVSGIGNGVFFAWSDEQGRYAQYEAHAYRHHHAPTVEDVLRDYACRILMAGCIDEEDELVDEYAAKLQLRGDE